jgi:tetratricopeptide (TPR) repeat protein
MDQRTISKLALLILLAALTLGAVGMAALNVHFTHGGTETLALGRAAEKCGQHDEAISLFTKAIESKDLSADDTVIAYVRRGFSFALAGDPQRAIKDFDEAIHLNPQSPLGYGGRGMIHITMRKCDLAGDELSKAIEKDRNYAPAYFGRGFCHFIKWEYSEAARDFQRELGAC